MSTDGENGQTQMRSLQLGLLGFSLEGCRHQLPGRGLDDLAPSIPSAHDRAMGALVNRYVRHLASLRGLEAGITSKKLNDAYVCWACSQVGQGLGRVGDAHFFRGKFNSPWRATGKPCL